MDSFSKFVCPVLLAATGCLLRWAPHTPLEGRVQERLEREGKEEERLEGREEGRGAGRLEMSLQGDLSWGQRC